MTQSGKFGIKKIQVSSGSLGIFDITTDKQIKVIVENAGPTNVVAVYGKIQGQNAYQLIDTVVGSTSKLIDVALFDFLELEVVAYDTIGNYIDISGSGFVTSTTSSGGTAADVNVLNFPNPQNVAVVNSPNVITDLSANSPLVSKITLANIGTEYTLVLPTNTKKFSIRVTDYSAVATISFVSSGTSLAIPRGCSYTVDLIQLQSGNRTLYLKSNKSNTVIECVSWV
jgi:hypothetical protein